jgi:hypothetical protein
MMSPGYLNHNQQLERAIAIHQVCGIAEVYHALLFMPAAHTREIERFWEWERRKMKKFMKVMGSSVVIYKRGILPGTKTRYIH